MVQRDVRPTGLRAAVRAAKMTMRELATESQVAESTLHYWARNGIPRKERANLARIIGCNEQELSFNQEKRQAIIPQEFRMVYEEMDQFFTFGRLKTAEIVLDGDGTRIYLPEHIRSHYIPVAQELPPEFQARKERIQSEQAERKARGDSWQWNGERYNLTRFNISRDPVNEDMTLDLWFRPSDYYTFLATSSSLQEPEVRDRYLADAEWDDAIPLFAHSFSILLTVLSNDGHAILVQRGKALGCRPNVFDVSIAEGLSRTLDRGAASQAPNVYRCAVRGLAEELGMQTPGDFSASDIHLLSFAVDTEYAMWGLFGMVKLQKSTEEILQNVRRGVQDRFENKRIFSVPFTPEEICSFVFEHQPFSPGGITCLYHALVHEFGREKVDTALSAYN